MSSREKILEAVKAAQPELIPLPNFMEVDSIGTIEKFSQILESIGGKVFQLNSIEEVLPAVEKLFPDAKRIVSAITFLERYNLKEDKTFRHQTLHDADVVIIEAAFAVAENGAVWLTEENAKIRVLPFIGEHLVVLVKADKVVANMHQAYNIIGADDYGFGVFIAGPSKTADIEQSLVLGAHGPKTMTIFFIQ
jgi:L-lactate dehydrogenase complex protein LldG